MKNFLDFFCIIINMIISKFHPTISGSKMRINGVLYRRGRGTLQIGENVTINSSKHSNFLGGNSYSTIFVNKGKKIKIGNNVGISNATIICYEKILIEDNVLIGADVKIYDTDFHSLEFQCRQSIETDIAYKKSIKIEKGAFIGAHSIILKGVNIGENSVVGAGSVITKSIPKNEIWAGNPAKYIRKLKPSGD